jgi:hypothetical protein
MNPSDVAPMIVGVAFMAMIGAIALFRPITKKLGTYLEVLAEERRRQLTAQPMDRVDAARIAQLLETMDNRLAQLEERQEFTDRLLVERTKPM